MTRKGPSEMPLATGHTTAAATAGEGAAGPPARPARASSRQWLWDHIGRLTGLLLGACAFAFICLLAALGWAPAYGLVVLVVVGVLMIAVGGRIRGR